MDMEVELERELAAEQEELLEEVQERMMQAAVAAHAHRPLAKVYSLPANFTFTSLCANEKGKLRAPRRAASRRKKERAMMRARRTAYCVLSIALRLLAESAATATASTSRWRRPSMAGKKSSLKGYGKRRQTLHADAAPRGGITPSALAAVLSAVPATAAASVPASSTASNPHPPPPPPYVPPPPQLPERVSRVE